MPLKYDNIVWNIVYQVTVCLHVYRISDIKFILLVLEAQAVFLLSLLLYCKIQWSQESLAWILLNQCYIRQWQRQHQCNPCHQESKWKIPYNESLTVPDRIETTYLGMHRCVKMPVHGTTVTPTLQYNVLNVLTIKQSAGQQAKITQDSEIIVVHNQIDTRLQDITGANMPSEDTTL